MTNDEMMGHIAQAEATGAPITPRTSGTRMTFAECFAACAVLVAYRADRTCSVTVEAWQHNGVPNTLTWHCWLACVARAVHAPTPEALVIAAQRALADKQDMMTVEEVTL